MIKTKYNTIKLEIDEAGLKATITLNRPEKLNSMNLEMVEELIAAFGSLHDAKINVIILTGAGDKFCAGADLGGMVKRSATEWGFVVERYLDIIRAIIDVPVPVVAAMNGDAVGGGLGLCTACDLRIAKEDNMVGFPFIKIGISGSDMGASYFLPKLVGHTKAAEMLYSGELIRAREGEQIGLITCAVANDEFESTVEKYVKTLADGPGYALRFTKRALVGSLDNCRDRQFDLETYAQTQCLQTQDAKEGIDAFLNKRKAKYTGE